MLVDGDFRGRPRFLFVEAAVSAVFANASLESSSFLTSFNFRPDTASLAYLKDFFFSGV